MKARIKSTGEIVEVEDLYDDGTALVNGRYFKVSELDFFDNFETIDWEQRRYELAKSMMAAFLSNSCSNVYMNTYENQAQEAVKYADVLIEELKKGK
jgi:hypothetical protein|nr:MAG TPA: hypothetical protein [Caudoviricetes sp.]